MTDLEAVLRGIFRFDKVERLSDHYTWTLKIGEAWEITRGDLRVTVIYHHDLRVTVIYHHARLRSPIWVLPPRASLRVLPPRASLRKGAVFPMERLDDALAWIDVLLTNGAAVPE